MTKKFEEYNRKYAHLARTDEMEEPHIQDLARDTDRWYERIVVQPSQDAVLYAVYMAPDHEEWQKFRCSLKGQSTRMKLTRLWLYLQECNSKAQSTRNMDLCRVRVNNYLHALIRGGQLGEDLVIKS